MMKIVVWVLFLIPYSFGASAQVLQIQRAKVDSSEIQVFDSLIVKAQESEKKAHGLVAALSYYGDAHRHAQMYNYLEGRAFALRQIARLEADADNRSSQALRYFLAELELRQAIGDPLEIACSYHLLGEFFRHNLSNDFEALGYFRQALLLREKFNAEASLIKASCEKVAHLYQYIDQPEEEAHYLEKLLALQKDGQNPEETLETMLRLMHSYSKQKNLDEAKKYAQKIKDLHERLPLDLRQEIQVDFEVLLRLLEEAGDVQDKRDERKSLFYLQIILGVLFLLVLVGVSLFRFFKYMRKKKSKMKE